jgi:hypothetical protein
MQQALEAAEGTARAATEECAHLAAAVRRAGEQVGLRAGRCGAGDRPLPLQAPSNPSACRPSGLTPQDARVRRALAERTCALKAALVDASSRLRGAHNADRRGFREVGQGPAGAVV